MRKLAALTAAIAFAGGMQVAAAADISYKDAPYEAPLAPIWSGFYVGGHAGGLWNDGGDAAKFWKWKWENESQWKDYEYAKFSEDDDDATFIGGIHVGYNWQSGARVFGIEADASFGDGVDYLASLRGRLGYAMDNFLIYATAGVAFAGFDDSAVVMSIGDYTHSYEFSGDSKVGFVVGGGVEYKLRPNWSIGLEGLYYAFGDSEDSTAYEIWCKDYEVTHEDNNDMFVVRARMSYHLQDAYDEPLK